MEEGGAPRRSQEVLGGPRKKEKELVTMAPQAVGGRGWRRQAPGVRAPEPRARSRGWRALHRSCRRRVGRRAGPG